MRIDQREKGFVLVSVLLLALLYFALIELVMADGARRSVEAQRFRARITANILAENGAELAARQMIHLDMNEEKLQTSDGEMEGSFRRLGEDRFLIEARGRTAGVIRTQRHVVIRGRIDGSSVRIDRTRHDR